MEAQLFYFCKQFKAYFRDYARDVDSIFLLKNGKLDAAVFVDAVASGSVGFEALHFLLFRVHNAFLLIDILWKVMRSVVCSHLH